MQARDLVFLIFLVYGLAIQAQQYPAPGQCTGDCANIQDISIIQSDDGTYYRFAAHSGIQIAKSKSLIGPWKTQSLPALPAWFTYTSLMPNILDTWSPDVHKVGNTYYMFYSVENFGTGTFGLKKDNQYKYANIAMATSKSLEPGTWKNMGLLGVPGLGPSYTRIGPSVLVDGSHIYMSFGSYAWGIYGISLQNPPLRVSGDAATMLTADEAVPGSRTNRTEGSYLYKRNGFYYLFYSAGNCCPGSAKSPDAAYKIKVCRADAVDGPYFAQNATPCLDGEGGTLLLPSHDNVLAPGSCSVFEDPTHGTVLIYQYMDRHIGMGEPMIRMGWNSLVFENDWPVLKG
jgi:arabinan endo-1,5-alpha-L-arabinosidase